MHDKETLAVWTVIFIAIGVLGYFVTTTSLRLQALQEDIAARETAPVDVSGWLTYRNDTYGFEFEYPPTWQISIGGLETDNPTMAIGNPLDGTSTYQMNISIESNPSGFTSGGYVHALLDAARAEDQANAKSSSTPKATPIFDRSYVLTAGSYPAFELYNVFEFDRRTEQIYISHATETIRFDFPVAQENPNIFLPVANNGIAHDIVNTIAFTK